MSTTELTPQNAGPAPAATAAEINRCHEEATRAAGTAVEWAVRAGELLAEVKAGLPHGSWLPWLRENFDGHATTARDYMRLAVNGVRALDLGATSVRQALKALEPPRKELPAPAEQQADGPAERPIAVARDVPQKADGSGVPTFERVGQLVEEARAAHHCARHHKLSLTKLAEVAQRGADAEAQALRLIEYIKTEARRLMPRDDIDAAIASGHKFPRMSRKSFDRIALWEARHWGKTFGPEDIAQIERAHPDLASGDDELNGTDEDAELADHERQRLAAKGLA